MRYINFRLLHDINNSIPLETTTKNLPNNSRPKEKNHDGYKIFSSK